MSNPKIMSLTDFRDIVLSNVWESYDLIYIDYDDRLNSEQIGYYLMNDWEALWESFSDWESDARYSGYEYHLREAVDEALEEALRSGDWDEDSVREVADEFPTSEEEEYFREEVLERESGDWFNTLVCRTSPIFVRIPLADVDDGVWTGGSLIDESEEAAAQRVEDELVTLILPRINLGEDTLRPLVRRWIEDYGACDYTYLPFVFGSFRPSDLLRYEGGENDTITLTGGTLLLEDIWAGAGMDFGDYSDELGELKITVPRKNLLPDAEAPGWGWDEVCGLVPGLWPITFDK